MQGAHVILNRRSRNSKGKAQSVEPEDELHISYEASMGSNSTKTERFMARTYTKSVGEAATAQPGHTRTKSLSDWMLGSTPGQWVVMLILGVLINLSGSFAWWLTPGTDEFPSDRAYQAWWVSLMFMIDVGTQTGLKAEDRGICHAVAVTLSMVGFAYVLALMGMVVDVIRNQLDHLKREKSRLFFLDRHVLLLGWCDKTLYLLHELIAADQFAREMMPKKGGCCHSQPKRLRRKIVILAKRPEFEMKEDVKTYLHFRLDGKQFRMGSSSIVFRDGDPSDHANLKKVNASAAEVILIMGGAGDTVGTGADEHVMQTLLALAALHLECIQAGGRGLCNHVFADMQHKSNVRVMNDIFPEAKGIVARHAVNRMFVLRGLAPNVGYAYLELATFNRLNQIWVLPVPDDLVGRPFSEVWSCFPDAVILGVMTDALAQVLRRSDILGADTRTRIAPELVPQFNRRLLVHDRLLMIAPNLAACRPSPGRPRFASTEQGDQMVMHEIPRFEDLVTPEGQLMLGPSSEEPKVIIMIGCPPDYADFLQIIDENLSKGTKVHILSERPPQRREEDLRRFLGEPDATLDSLSKAGQYFKRIEVFHYYAPTTSEWGMKKLPFAMADCALILSECFSKNDSPIKADSRSLTSVITLRRLMPKGKTHKSCKVVTELIHPKSNGVVEGNNTIRRHGSFFYTTALETGLFALATEDKLIYDILMEILHPENGNSTLAAFPIKHFVRGTESLTFYDLYRRTVNYCGGVLIGWRRKDEYYPVINPTEVKVPGSPNASKADVIEWREDSADELLVFCTLKSRSTDPSPQAKASCASIEPSGVEPLVGLPGSLASPVNLSS
mmetsp:Transcript_149414/g.271993  ORF Transcript_149414/g.271993 Transcript_149414/m.271993 type:complete len:841 (-) Transcript_149414:97-2619(-)